MAKRPVPTIRCWVPDIYCPGGYKPLESLDPNTLTTFKKSNTKKLIAGIKEYYQNIASMER